ncbi:Serine/threonine-protein phosphatase 2A regulatory subunit B'' subunit alpha [Linderina pennispora]|nr:Serine/threonine-protein phosphatase 2A regulatory subunit B'' subunit alpha [Linderina pennispora]
MKSGSSSIMVASLPSSEASSAGTLTSPLSKRARIIQSDSSETLPPLSPVVSNRKRAFRSDLTQDTPFPFSPTSSGLRINYPPSSPLSPTESRKPVGDRGELESPTLSRMRTKGASLALDEKLGLNSDDDESPTMSQVSQSLLFHLDLDSPTSRRPLQQGGGDSDALSPLPQGEAGKKAAPATTPQLCSSLSQVSADEASGTGVTPAHRGSSSLNDLPATSKIEHSKKMLVARKQKSTIPQLHVSPLNPRVDGDIEHALKLQLQQAQPYFASCFGARETDFVKVTEICGLPQFANRALFRYVTRQCPDQSASPTAGSRVTGKRIRPADRGTWPSFAHFSDVWTRLRRTSADVHAMLFNILVDDATAPRASLSRDDIRPLVTDVLDHHPELEFLEGEGLFSQRYTETVVERIFYVTNRSWDGKITLPQFRKADVVGMLRGVEDGIDVGVDSPGVFSYKHFYVLYCSFFELDSNRDQLLDARDLLCYFTGTLSRRIISRIMMGKGKPFEYKSSRRESARAAKARQEKRLSKGPLRYDLNVRLSDCRMTFKDFIWFLLSEIDKTTPAALEYWFRCLDLDGDGVLTAYELEYFYDEQVCRMEEEMAGDLIMLDDLVCQLSDMVRPEREGMFTLKDLRKVPPTQIPVFIDAFTNLTRFLEHESRTSFLQRQLAQISARALPASSFDDVIRMRIDFLASMPNPWIEFADMEYAALLKDQQEQENGASNAGNESDHPM